MGSFAKSETGKIHLMDGMSNRSIFSKRFIDVKLNSMADRLDSKDKLHLLASEKRGPGPRPFSSPRC